MYLKHLLCTSLTKQVRDFLMFSIEENEQRDFQRFCYQRLAEKLRILEIFKFRSWMGSEKKKITMRKKSGYHLNIEHHPESQHLNLKYILPATGLKRRSLVLCSCSSLYFDICFIIIFNFVRMLCVAYPISIDLSSTKFENCFLLFFLE